MKFSISPRSSRSSNSRSSGSRSWPRGGGSNTSNSNSPNNSQPSSRRSSRQALVNTNLSRENSSTSVAQLRQRTILRTPENPDLEDENSAIMGITDIAIKMIGVVKFIRAELLTGAVAQSLPQYQFLCELVDGIVDYAWPGVNERLVEAHMPGENNKLDADEAALTMEQLTGFFEREIKKYSEVRIDVLKIVKLRDGCRFAATYTKLLVAALRSGYIQGNLTGVPGVKHTGEPEPEIAANRASTVIDNRKSRASTYITPSLLEDFEEPQLLQAQTANIVKPRASKEGVQQVTASSYKDVNHNDTKIRESLTAQVLQPDVIRDKATGKAIDKAPEEILASLQNILDEHQQFYVLNLEVPKELQGRRLISRSWFEDDANFAELIGVPEQWLGVVPEEYTTIEGGDGISCLPRHFCNARPLGISALHVIEYEHPLEPRVLEQIDYDILKFVRLVLYDWTDGHPEREAEMRSLELVRREIRARKKEINKAKDRALQAAQAVKTVKVPQRYVLNPDPIDEVDAAQEVARDALRVPFSGAVLSTVDEESAFDNDVSDEQLAKLSAIADDGLEQASSLNLGPSWLDSNNGLIDAEIEKYLTPKNDQIPHSLPIHCGPSTSKEFQGVEPRTQCDSDDFTTLLRKSKLAALGADVDFRMPVQKASPPGSVKNARLEAQVKALAKQLAQLQAQIGSLPLDTRPSRMEPRSAGSGYSSAVSSRSDLSGLARAYTSDGDMSSPMSMLSFLKTSPEDFGLAMPNRDDPEAGKLADQYRLSCWKNPFKISKTGALEHVNGASFHMSGKSNHVNGAPSLKSSRRRGRLETDAEVTMNGDGELDLDAIPPKPVHAMTCREV